MSKKERILNMNSNLPQIILPGNKIQMFVDWWNSDIRFETSVPHAFEKGYFILQDIFPELGMSKETRHFISTVASSVNKPYKEIKDMYIKFVETYLNKNIMYFKFDSENTISVEQYSGDGVLMSTYNFAVGKSKPEKEIHWFDEQTFLNLYLQTYTGADYKELLNAISCQYLSLLVTSLWYIATTKRKVTYKYKDRKTKQEYDEKRIVNVPSKNVIKTPIFSFKEIRYVKTEQLSKRKAGWTYSHSFQVHGHYRHYKNGKVVFVKSYIKGKDKQLQQQTIELKPESWV